MEIKDFIEKFAEQFEDTEVDVFTPQTRYKELDEWSSLTALSVIAMIDEEYSLSVKGDDISQSDTIEDLFKRITL